MAAILFPRDVMTSGAKYQNFKNTIKSFARKILFRKKKLSCKFSYLCLCIQKTSIVKTLLVIFVIYQMKIITEKSCIQKLKPKTKKINTHSAQIVFYSS